MKLTRQQTLAGIAVALGGAVARLTTRADAQMMQEQRTDDTRTSLNERETYRVGASRIYNALLDSKTFSEVTHAPAEIEPAAGGEFSLFGGRIVGRNIELVRNVRIVQAWRSDKVWQPGAFSIVRFDLVPQGDQTALSITQTGFPEGMYEHLYAGWRAHYLQRLAQYFT